MWTKNTLKTNFTKKVHIDLLFCFRIYLPFSLYILILKPISLSMSSDSHLLFLHFRIISYFKKEKNIYTYH